MELKGLEKSLKEGCKLHGFRSGGGLRVIRLEQEGDLRGYGEHPNVEDALSHADENFLAGGKKYNEVYGKSKPYYMTGSQNATSPLDNWLLRGKTIDAYIESGEVVVELRGLTQTDTPETIEEQIRQTGKPIAWHHRGYTFETKLSDRFHSTNGELAYSTRILKSPEGKNGSDPWMYNVLKVGKGNGFFEAVESAIKAQEIEVVK